MEQWNSGTDAYLAGERYHVMLAEAEDLDVLDDDHLVMSLVEYGVVDDILDILLVSFGEM